MFVQRQRTEWQLRRGVLEVGLRTQVMGIVNVTPDSFSDGGLYNTTDRAVEHALALLEEGADILDIGGESTRPGAHGSLTVDEEQERILPVIEELLKVRPKVILSIDTYHAATARAAVDAGAEIVNDVSGFLWDAAMAQTCADLKCGVVLMHTRGTPEEWKNLLPLEKSRILPLVREELSRQMQVAYAAGVTPEHIVLDPGYGFGKIGDENYVLLNAQAKLRGLGRPLLAGISRKASLGHTLAALYGVQSVPPEERDNATVAATVAAVLAGADIVRVHNVRPTVEAVCIADAILQSATSGRAEG